MEGMNNTGSPFSTVDGYDALESYQRELTWQRRIAWVGVVLLWTVVILLFVSLASGCGEPPGLEGAANAQTDAPACDEGLGKVQAAVKCDVSSSYQAPGAVLCYEHGLPKGGCTVEEQDSPATLVYRALCVAACPQGFALMSPEAVAYLRTAHPELF